MNNQTLNRELKMAELERIKTDAEKLRAETMKIQKETQYYPMIAILMTFITSVAAIIVACIALLK